MSSGEKGLSRNVCYYYGKEWMRSRVSDGIRILLCWLELFSSMGESEWVCDKETWFWLFYFCKFSVQLWTDCPCSVPPLQKSVSCILWLVWCHLLSRLVYIPLSEWSMIGLPPSESVCPSMYNLSRFPCFPISFELQNVLWPRWYAGESLADGAIQKRDRERMCVYERVYSVCVFYVCVHACPWCEY